MVQWGQASLCQHPRPRGLTYAAHRHRGVAVHKGGADKARHPSYTELLNALSGAMEPKPQSGHRALWGFFVGNGAQDGGALA
jgi:hypothetical protein